MLGLSLPEGAAAAPQDGNDSLDVRIRRRRFSSLRLLSGVLYGTLLFCCIAPAPLACFRRPRSVLPDVGCQDLHDRPVVFFGLPGDPFEGVDTAYPDLQQLVVILTNLPELIDGPGEALGDLPFAVDLQGAPGEVEAREECRAAQNLCQSQHEILLLTRLCGGNVPVQ